MRLLIIFNYVERPRFQDLRNSIGLGISGILLAACAPVVAAAPEISVQGALEGQEATTTTLSTIDTCYGYVVNDAGEKELYLVDMTGAPAGAEQALEHNVTCYDSDPNSPEYPQFAVSRSPNGELSVSPVDGLTPQQVDMAFEGQLEYMR